MKLLLLDALGGAVLAALALFAFGLWRSGSWGLADVAPSEVAVKTDYLTGELTVIDEPGFHFVAPYFQSIDRLDRRPQLFLMEGETDKHANHVSYLTVRARDGSNFWFESMELQYRMVPSAGDLVLRDSGAGDAFRRWTRSYARAVLRDEFGRYDAQDVADLAESQTAKAESMRRLNELLAPHGVEIVQIITPKPKFDRTYEKAIYDRKIANQEVEKLSAQLEQLLQERGQRLAKINKEKELELAEVRGQLEHNRLKAEEKEIQTRSQADAYAALRVSDGEAKRAELLAEAESVAERLAKEAEGLAAAVESLAVGGEAAVRLALIERLGEIRFTVAPPRAETLDGNAVAKQQGGF